MFGVIMAAVFSLLLTASVYLVVRCAVVHRYRMRLLAEIKTASLDDAMAGREWQWRYEAFNNIAPRSMLKPYPWRRLLRPIDPTGRQP